MTGLEKIKQGILDEAEESVKALLAKAKTEAREIEQAKNSETSRICREIADAADAREAAFEEHTKSAIELARNLKILEAKQAVIADVLAAAKKELHSLPGEQYFAILLKLAKKAIHAGNCTVFFSENDLKRLPDGFPEKLQQIADAKGAKLTLSAEAANIKDGFIASYGGIEENCTFDALFDAKKDELSDIAQSVLFC